MHSSPAPFLSYSCSAHLEQKRVGVTSANSELLASVTPNRNKMRMKIRSQSCYEDQPTLPPWEEASQPRAAQAQGIFCCSVTVFCGGCRLSQSRLRGAACQGKAAGTPVAEGTRDSNGRVRIIKRPFYASGLEWLWVSSSEGSGSQALSSRGPMMRHLKRSLQIHSSQRQFAHMLICWTADSISRDTDLPPIKELPSRAL